MKKCTHQHPEIQARQKQFNNETEKKSDQECFESTVSQNSVYHSDIQTLLRQDQS